MGNEYKGLKKKTRELLNGSEGIDVEFKLNPSAVKPDVLVAFANSNLGGTILVGVEEIQGAKNIQKGRVVGCDCSDSSKLQIQNIASDCTPPIELQINIENINTLPVFRIEVPSGRNKPYTTKSGSYKIREDGRSRALHPDELLAIFMNKEGDKFLSRFKESVMGLEGLVQGMDNKVSTELEKLIISLKNLNKDVFTHLEDIFYQASLSTEEASDAGNTVEEVWRRIDLIGNELNYIVGKIDSSIEEDKLNTLEYKLDKLMTHLGIGYR